MVELYSLEDIRTAFGYSVKDYDEFKSFEEVGISRFKDKIFGKFHILPSKKIKVDELESILLDSNVVASKPDAELFITSLLENAGPQEGHYGSLDYSSLFSLSFSLVRSRNGTSDYITISMHNKKHE